MKVYTQRQFMKAAVTDWLGDTYHHVKRSANGWDVEAVAKALRALDLDECAPEDVAAAFRVNGLKRPIRWQYLACDECDKEVPEVVHFGHEPDYDSRWWYVCAECLGRATTVHAQGENP